MNEQQKIGALEAMLFAHADPVEAARLADALRVEPEEVVRLLKKLQRKLDEEESGHGDSLLRPRPLADGHPPYYGEMVKRILDTRRNAPLSPPRWRCCQSLPTTSLSPAALLSRSAAWIPRPS